MKKIFSLIILFSIFISVAYSQDIYIPEDYPTLKEYYIEAVLLYEEAEKDNSILIQKLEKTISDLEKALSQLESNNKTLEENKDTILEQSKLIEELKLAIIELKDTPKYKLYRHGVYFNYSTKFTENSYSIGYTGLVFNTISFSIGFDIPIQFRLGFSYYFN